MGVFGAALLLAAASPAAAQDVAGLYEINQMEMAGGLELRAHGRVPNAHHYIAG